MKTPAFNTIIAHLDRLPPEERAEMARSVEQMTLSHGWQVFTRILEARIQSQRDLTESWAGIPDHVEMVSQAATLRGLLTAQTIPEAVRVSGERADDELRRIVMAQEAAHA